MTIIRKVSSALSLDFLADGTTYLVSGDDGLIRRASRAYSDQCLSVYEGHLSSVYRVRTNPAAPGFFLSCSADRTCRVWSVDQAHPLITLRTPSDDHVYAAEWCPYRSTCLLSGTRQGTVEIWDVSDNSVYPILTISDVPTRRKEAAAVAAAAAEALEAQNAAIQKPGARGKPAPPPPPPPPESCPVRALACNRKVPVFAACYETGEVAVYRINGVESALILSRVDPTTFAEIETERLIGATEHKQDEES